ncbi:MAG: DUF1015 domain-containing protein [Phycisphaeraceae bacterium]
MPQIHAIPAVTYAAAPGTDLSDRIAPPYDVLDQASKQALLEKSEQNIVKIDLPYLPPKTVGPDAVYEEAGETYRQWLENGTLARRDTPALFVYQQTFATIRGDRFQRRGVIANLDVQPFGPGPEGRGGIYPHEQTFASAKEDRLKLMRATEAQLSPIFGLYSDRENRVGPLLDEVIRNHPPTFKATTSDDGVLHELWAVDDPAAINRLRESLGDHDVFIADGHHRYTTALNYKQELESQGKEPGGAAKCLFVLVSIQDPGMIVLPTHRVLGNMANYSMDAFREAAKGKLDITPVPGTRPEELAGPLSEATGPHAVGLYDPSAEQPLAIATTTDPDPLARRFPDQSDAWRQLDVAIVQHLIVEDICQPSFCQEGEEVAWKFPHDIEEVARLTGEDDFQLGLVLRPTPLEAVQQISEAGELMPQKSTFFYPKLATGLVINPLD